jgi:DNA-binding transcriptional MerR regulator
MKHEYLQAGELAATAGISADTLHHYERVGVLPPVPRGTNRYRQYPVSTLKRITMIRMALDLGFTLRELARFFRLRSHGVAPCQGVRDLAETKLDAVREEIRVLRMREQHLESTLASWDDRLEAAGSSEPARLLESLSDE